MADFIRHVYRIERVRKTYVVYQLQQVCNGSPLLTDKLRIEPFRGYSKANGIEHYLRLRTTDNWKTCEQVTGLRPTGRPGLFEGNRAKGKKTLLLFTFSKDRQKLFIDVFRAFYPSHKGILKKIVEQHPTPLNEKREAVQTSQCSNALNLATAQINKGNE